MMNCFGDKDTEILLLQNSEKQLMQRIKQLDGELAALREELAHFKDGSQHLLKSLAAAERRNSELVELLDLVRDEDGYHYTDKLKARIAAALKPTESGASE